MKHQAIIGTQQYNDHVAWALGVSNDGVPIWERQNVRRVVSMAANIVSGHLITGNRHFCPIMIMSLEALGLTRKNGDENWVHDPHTDQGFVDQWGIYMTREEAWTVAEKAGQIKRVYTEGVLFSECYL